MLYLFFFFKSGWCCASLKFKAAADVGLVRLIECGVLSARPIAFVQSLVPQVLGLESGIL